MRNSKIFLTFVILYCFSITMFCKDAAEYVKDVKNKAGEYSEQIKDKANEYIDQVKDKTKGTSDAIKKKAGEVYEQANETLSEGMDNADSIYESIKNGTQRVMNTSFGDAIYAGVDAVESAAKEALNMARNAANATMPGMFKDAENIAENIYGKVKSGIDAAYNFTHGGHENNISELNQTNGNHTLGNTTKLKKDL